MKQTFGLITLACALLIGCGAQDGSVELTATQEQQVAERIAPVGHVLKRARLLRSSSGWRRQDVLVATFTALTAWVVMLQALLVHLYLVMLAPGLTDLEQGIETVYTNAINGIRGMPMRGTCMDCSDDEVKAAVDHILDNSK